MLHVPEPEGEPVTTAIDTLGVEESATSTRPIPWEKLRWLPLIFILAIQVVLSARLIPEAPFPSGDEGRYIYGGHQLIYELWHGGGSPFTDVVLGRACSVPYTGSCR